LCHAKGSEKNESSVSAVSGVRAVSSASEKNGKSEDAGCAKKSERSERSGMAVSSVSSMSVVSGVGEKNRRIKKNERIEKNEGIERNEKKAGARSGPSERIVRLSRSGDTTGEAARGRAGHVELQVGSSGTIPVFTQDEIRIHPDHGNQEVPRFLEPSDHSDDLRIRLPGTERSSKGPKIRPTLDGAGIVSLTEIEGRRKEFERCREWDPGETTKEHLGQPKGQERLLCLAGVDGLDEVLAVAPPLDSEAVGLSTMATSTRMRAVFKAPEQGMNPLTNSEIHFLPDRMHGQMRCFAKNHTDPEFTQENGIRKLSQRSVPKEKKFWTCDRPPG